MRPKLKICIVALICVFLASSITHGKTLSRRGIEVKYDFQNISDGFGNLKSISVNGAIKNTTDQDASRITVLFELFWQSRRPITRKLKFRNVLAGTSKEFQFEIDLGSNPDLLLKITPQIARIKFSKMRKASPVTARDLSSRELYSLARLNEEGKAFENIIGRLIKQMPFRKPLKDEFETTDEYESRVNYAENEHFGLLLDKLEKSYGELLDGRGAIVRYLPRKVNNELVYISENSAYFQIPIKFGRYNADMNRYEDVNLSPRTFGFAPDTILPESDIELTQKSGHFFLRRPFFDIRREEAKILRNTEQYIILEVSFRTGVIQEGPYPEDFCIVEEILLKNTKTGKLHRRWASDSD